jgi:hypothetical protein
VVFPARVFHVKSRVSCGLIHLLVVVYSPSFITHTKKKNWRTSRDNFGPSDTMVGYKSNGLAQSILPARILSSLSPRNIIHQTTTTCLRSGRRKEAEAQAQPSLRGMASLRHLAAGPACHHHHAASLHPRRLPSSSFPLRSRLLTRK